MSDPQPDGLVYVIVQRQILTPPAPFYPDLATAVAALDQIRRENPTVAEQIVLMAVAPESALPGDSQSSGMHPSAPDGGSTDVPAGDEVLPLAVAEVPVPLPPEP